MESDFFPIGPMFERHYLFQFEVLSRIISPYTWDTSYSDTWWLSQSLSHEEDSGDENFEVNELNDWNSQKNILTL